MSTEKWVQYILVVLGVLVLLATLFFEDCHRQHMERQRVYGYTQCLKFDAERMNCREAYGMEKVEFYREPKRSAPQHKNEE